MGKKSGVIGMQELVDRLDKMGNVGNKVANKALNQAGTVVKKQQVETAEKTHSKYSENVGTKAIKKYGVKKRKLGGKCVDIGIKTTGSNNKTSNSGRNSYWSQAKGLYYNHYGFYHNRTGQYITGSHWMDKAFEETQDEAYKIMKQHIVNELGL